jgi:hypothetical protein
MLYLSALAWDVVDDAYISFRYAENLSSGHGLVFNVGERVEGYTNFLWTLLLSPLQGVGAAPNRAAVVLGLALSALTLCLVYSEGRRTGAGWTGPVAALLLALDGSFAMWSVGGMETAMFACLLFIAGTAYRSELCCRSVHKWPRSGLLFVLAALVRPEGVMLFAATVGHQALVRLRDRERPWQRRDLVRIALFAGSWGAYFLGRWRYYGFFLPNTFYVKVDPGGPWDQILRGGRYVIRFARIHLAHLVWLPLAVGLLSRRMDRWTSYVLTIAGVHTAYVVYVGGDWSVGRFLVPLLPFLYLFLAQGLVDTYRWVQGAVPWRPALLRSLGLGLLVALLVGIAAASSWWGEYALFVRPYNAGLANRARVAMGRWLRENVPANATIAVDAAGELAYYSRLRTIDLFGITQPAIAHMDVPGMGQGTPGHEKFGLGFVLSQQPEYIIIYGDALDGVDPYERLDVEWTHDPELESFLSIYGRRAGAD